MSLKLGSVPALVVSSADAARQIMKTHDLIFSSRPKLAIAAKLLYDYKDISLAPYGEYWRQLRSIAVLQLLSNKRVYSFRSVREEETALMVEKIKESCSLKNTPLDLSEMFASLTNDVVCRVALGRKYGGGESGRTVKALLLEFVELLGGFDVGDLIPWLGWVNRVSGLDAKVDKISKEFDRFLDRVVDEHVNRRQPVNGEGRGYSDDGEDGEQQKDFVDVLLEVQKDSTTGFPIGKVNIKALILDMFAAGTDTTYTVLEWAMTELLRHPRVLKILQSEVRNMAGPKREISEDDLYKMPYLKAVIKETLRLHPPIPLLVPRESTADVKIMGYDIPAGTRVITNAWAIGRDPTSWERPEEFWPERFINSDIDFKGQNFELIPFGAGRRGCPGFLFAVSLEELVLATIVHKFDWELPYGMRGEDLDMTECTGLTIHRKSPLLAVAIPWP